jgi:hypothetical protein
MKIQYISWLGLFSLFSCAGGQIAVESDPVGAEIAIIVLDGSRRVVGKTPMSFNRDAYPELFSQNTQLSIAKDGFHGESFMLPRTSGTVNGRIKAQLREDEVTKVCQDSIRTLMEATDAVAQIQRMIYRKDYVEAEKALNTIAVKFASVPVFHSLLGNVYYLQKNVTKALESYERANILQPQNQEALRMIEKLKGIRSSAGGGN